MRPGRRYAVLVFTALVTALLSGCSDQSTAKIEEIEKRLATLEARTDLLSRYTDRSSTKIEEIGRRLAIVEDRTDLHGTREIDRFQLYKTQNLWTFLLLDTQTGMLWQCAYSVKQGDFRGKIPINLRVLDENGKPGQFVLHPTENIWTFLLVDRTNGSTWQVQYSLSDGQMILPIARSP